MPYNFYLDKLLLPVAPSELSLKIDSQNKTITLINEGEINILKKAKLTEFDFEALLPNAVYPFATYKKGFTPAIYYMDEIEKLKTGLKPFSFKVTRTFPNGQMMFDTEMTVSLEDYKITESAKNGFDIVVSITLKQYKEYGTKTVKIVNNKATVNSPRKTYNSPAPKSKPKTYTVVKGDCLWNIAKKFYGNGSKYKKIYNANKDKIKNPNKILPGQKLTIPV